jgi:hypothetical protein
MRTWLKFSGARTSNTSAVRHARRLLQCVLLATAGTLLMAGTAYASGGSNLVVNGDFSGGNTGFSSQYAYSPTGLGAVAQYAIAKDPAVLNGAWPTMAPLAGDNEMFIGNGAQTSNTKVWSETVSVASNSSYVFSLWAASLYSLPAVFEFAVNGVSIGTRSAPSTIGKWKELQITWNSGSATSAKLTIIDTNLNSGGNDFALDSIAFSGASPNSVAPIASTLGTPWQVFHSVSHDVVGGGITMAVLLFIAFPANIFNQTFSDHYAEIMSFVFKVRRRFRHPFGASATGAAVASSPSATATSSSNQAPGRVNRVWFGVTLLAGGILGGLLNPKFGMNAHSFEGLIATLIAFSVGAIVSWYIAKTFRRLHKYPSHTYLRALPMGLVIAAACVLVSRVSHFEPGYLYGVVISIAFIESMEDRHSVHLIAISTLSTLAVAVLAWFAWIPMNHLALQHGEFVEVILDDALASIFAGGLMGTVIALLPLEGLPGGHLSKWRKDVWGVIFFIALFLLIEVELNPDSGPTHPGGAPVVTAIVLFVIFGGLSIGLHRYFVRRSAARVAEAPPPSPAPSSD